MKAETAIASSRLRRAKTARIIAAVLALVGLVACGDDTLRLEYAEVNGTGTLGVRVVDEPVKGLIVYFHGSDQNAAFIRDSEKHAAFFEPLLRAGYAVVAADAGGNAYGNPKSRRDYRDLIAAAQATYSADATLYVAESMGALPALALLAENGAGRVEGLVGITPLMGIPPDLRDVTFIADQWGGQIPDAADPLSWSPKAFADRNIRLYEAERDRVIPRTASATAFRKRFERDANVEIVECQGDHVDPSCYQGEDVRRWLEGLN